MVTDREGSSSGESSNTPSDGVAMVAISAAVLEAMSGGPMQTAGIFDRALDVVVPQAMADVPIDGLHPSGCDSASPTQSWLDVDMNGPSGVFGSSQQSLSTNTNTSYCETPTGTVNAGSGLAKWFSIGPVVATCSWGGSYSVSASGASLRVGNSLNKRIYSGLGFTNLSNNRVGTANCTTLLINGSEDTELHATGTCSGWTGNLNVSNNMNCWLGATPAGDDDDDDDDGDDGDDGDDDDDDEDDDDEDDEDDDGN